MTSQLPSSLSELKNHFSNLLSEMVDFQFILIFICILLGLIYPVFFYAVWSYFILSAIADIYKMLKTAWDDPTDSISPMRGDKGFGFPLLFLISGMLAWSYLFKSQIISQEGNLLYMVAAGIVLVLIVPSILGAFFTVYGIEFVQYIRFKFSDTEKLIEDDNSSS